MKDIHNDFQFWFVRVIIVLLARETFLFLRTLVQSNLWTTLFLILAALPLSGLCVDYTIRCWKKDLSGNYIETASARRASVVTLVVGILGTVFLIVYPLALEH